MKTTSTRMHQKGMSLLEGLLAVLIFSVGILAMVALQATSVRATTDAKFRGDAGFLASQLIARMWTDYANVASYAYNTGGTYSASANTCTFAGGGGNPTVAAWSASVQSTLPGSSATMQQIIVTPAPDFLVTINICWQSGNEIRGYSTVTQIQM